MFRLRDLKNGLYQIHKDNGQAFEGTPLSVFEQAIKMGVVQSELLMAAESLKRHNHDYADFNSYGRLRWTRKNGVKA